MLFIVIQVITTYTMGVSICNIFGQMLLLVSKLYLMVNAREVEEEGRKEYQQTNQ